MPVSSNGLILSLEAGDSGSYPSSGTTWFDLSGNNNHGTLTNGPSYVFPYIGFDGTNDFVNFNSRIFNVPLNGTINEFTISLWVNWPSFQTNSLRSLVSWWAAGGQVYADGFLGVSTTSGSNGGNGTNAAPVIRFGDGWQDSGARFNSATDTNKWWNIVAIKTVDNAYIYINGVLVSTKGSPLDWGFNNNFRIGNQYSAAEHTNARISGVHLYNRALTPQEIQDNYDYFYNRYIVFTFNPVVKVENFYVESLGDVANTASVRVDNFYVESLGETGNTRNVQVDNFYVEAIGAIPNTASVQVDNFYVEVLVSYAPFRRGKTFQPKVARFFSNGQ